MNSIAAWLALASTTLFICAAPTQAAPEHDAVKEVGLSAERLQRVTQRLEDWVARGDIPGVVAIVARNGQIAQVNVVGWQDKNTKIKMRRDTIFRLASNTKHITAVATMMLFEEGKLRLDDPIEKWIPELAHPTVLRNPKGALDDARPAARSITIVDLLTHRSGLTNAYGEKNNTPLENALNKQLGGPLGNYPPDEWIKRLGALPLAYEPGARWNYGNSFDVLGVLIARVSGMTFPDFLRMRLFEPLGMKDTGFWVSDEKLDRLATCPSCGLVMYGTPNVSDPARGGRWSRAPIFPSGGGGLVSTADDYFKFVQMLLNHGKLGGTRILSRKSVELMTSNFLTPEQRTSYTSEGEGVGLGMYVIEDVTKLPALGSRGSFYGGGAFGPAWLADPKEGMALILMSQSGWNPQLNADFFNLAYQAIDN